MNFLWIIVMFKCTHTCKRWKCSINKFLRCAFRHRRCLISKSTIFSSLTWGNIAEKLINNMYTIYSDFLNSILFQLYLLWSTGIFILFSSKEIFSLSFKIRRIKILIWRAGIVLVRTSVWTVSSTIYKSWSEILSTGSARTPRFSFRQCINLKCLILSLETVKLY